ncbi:MAG: hypothetical protein NPIRA04_06850 [Nitrospirales bacterium]|nr:MAG: hypothetical protein NPIRA04_06850 [Nitrospirales bacterium]
MRTLQCVLVAAALVFCVGTAMAETNHAVTGAEGFHALSHLTSSGDQTMTALTDDQLDTVAGGYTPNPDAPIIIIKKWPFPWPGPVCLSCPYPYMDGMRDILVNPANLNMHVMGY